MSLPITSTTTSKSSTTCDAEYNTVTYSMTDSNFKQLQQSGMIPNETIINSLIQQSGSNTAKINTISMCVKKKCPDGNIPINVGKLMSTNLNIYGCIYMPDTVTNSDGLTTSTCKAGKTLSSLGENTYSGGPSPGSNSGMTFPEMCVSSPQIYFPKLQ
jgi:hypothetical protein